LAEEVVELLKEKCGKSVFAAAHTTVHQAAAVVKTKRKAERAMEVSNSLSDTRWQYNCYTANEFFSLREFFLMPEHTFRILYIP